MDMRWIYAEPSQETVRQLQEQLHISSLLARTLVNQGITDSTDAKHFCMIIYRHYTILFL